MSGNAVPRKVNFSAGPAVMPVEVLEEAKENLLSLGATGIGIMEHSHRGKPFVGQLEFTTSMVRKVLNVPDDYEILYLQGGATQQFFQVPMNFIQGKKADYIDTGSWSAKAIKDAKRYGEVNVAASSKDDNYTWIPKEYSFSSDAVYTHFTSNNTIFGTQFRTEPVAPAPLVCDASSDIASRPIDWPKYGLLYAGAQKNLGPAGTTLVIVKKDFAEQGADNIPALLQYRTQIANDSCTNTPPTFGIYLVGLTMKWIDAQGGLTAIQERNEKKAKILYDFLDSSDFWTTPVAKDDRSLMNVVWRLPSEDLEKKLIADATEAGFDGLKGHRSVGGLRASIYNAMPVEGVQGLVDFMKDWAEKHG